MRGDEIEVREAGAEPHARPARLRARAERAARRGRLHHATSRRATVARLVDDTVELARATAPDPDAGLPAGGFARRRARARPPRPGRPRACRSRRASRTRGAPRRAARGVDARIANSEGSERPRAPSHVVPSRTARASSASTSPPRTALFTHAGRRRERRDADRLLALVRRARSRRSRSPAAVGRRAAERALRPARLAAREDGAACRCLRGDHRARRCSATSRRASSGGALYRKSSFLAGRLGQRIAAEAVTIVDDGRRAGRARQPPLRRRGPADAAHRRRRARRARRAGCSTRYSARKLGLALDRQRGAQPRPARPGASTDQPLARARARRRSTS